MLNTYKKILLSTAYMPPVSWFKYLLNTDDVYIEKYEHYIKQTYRNRFHILAANGLMALSIPVEKARKKKILIKDVKIDYAVNWQKQHLKSLEAAYRNAPFYELLIDEFLPYYTKKMNFLFDFNYEIIKTVLDILEVNKELKFTDDFIEADKYDYDFRYCIKPKKQSKEITGFVNIPYYQNFNEKFSFIPDLSILDLLFNLGHEAYGYLKINTHP
jgi:hypothetical protein